MDLKGTTVQDYCLSKMNEAVVFLDPGSAAYFHWSGKKFEFLTCGARALVELRPEVIYPSNSHKAVFLLTDLLYALPDAASTSSKESFYQSTPAKAICQILQESGCTFDEILILTACSFGTLALAHNVMTSKLKLPSAKMSENEIVSYWQQTIMKWCNNSNCRVDLEHIPLGGLTLLPQVVLLPVPSLNIPQRDMEVLQRASMEQQQKQSVAMNAFSFLQIKGILDLLNNFLDSLNVKDEVYAMGVLSEFVGTELALDPQAKARRKKSNTQASVLLLDRMLDLHSVTSPCRDHLLDCIFRQLPPLNQQRISADVEVPLGRFLSACGSDEVVPSGYLCPIDGGPQAMENWKSFMESPSIKDALLSLNRRLQCLLDEHDLAELNSEPSSGNIAALLEHLKSSLELLKTNVSAAEMVSLLPQLLPLLATLRTQEQQPTNHMSRPAPLSGVTPQQVQSEKNFLMASTDPGEQEDLLVEFIKREKFLLGEDGNGNEAHKAYRLDSGFAALASFLDMIDARHDYNSQTIALLKEYLKILVSRELRYQDLSNDVSPSRIVTRLQENGTDNIDSSELSQYLVDVLHLATTSRASLHESRYRSSIIQGAVPELMPLVARLVRDIRKGAVGGDTAPGLQDWHLKSQGLRDMLKTGLGYFVPTVARTSPYAHPVVVICVMGTLTPYEIRAFLKATQETVSRSAPQSSQKIYLVALGLDRGDFQFLNLNAL